MPELTDWLENLGQRFALFDLQDSGSTSYGIAQASGRRLFVKTPNTDAASDSLRRALRFHAAVTHRAIVAPLESHEFGDRVAIVYPWCDGQVLYPASPLGRLVRVDPAGAWVAFRALPTERILSALDTVLDAHLAVIAAGFVAVDFYDGSLLYDFDRHEMRLIDLDEYRPGPFVLQADRLPGSTRFMAPEEFRRGAVIDERTTVYVLGRAMRLLLDATDEEREFRGNPAQLAVIERATRAAPESRYGTVAELRASWVSAR